MPPPPVYLDSTLFRKLWMSLPVNRCDRSFWNAMESFCDPFLDDNCPLRSQEYFTVPHSGRVALSDIHLIDEGVVARGNETRVLYDAFTLWNPLAVAALLNVPVSVVVEQLLLAVEYNIMALHFVVSCRSCAFDIKHFASVSEVPFHGTYHTRNAFRCPMCTDRTDVNSMSAVSVFFQLQKLHPIFQRSHHRSFVTEVAEKQKLETFFCPSGAGFATNLFLPRGKYLLAAPFMASMVELDVQVGASAFDEKDPFLPKIVDLKKYGVEPAGNRTGGKLKMGGGRRASGGNGLPPSASPARRATTQRDRSPAHAAKSQMYGAVQSRRSVANVQQQRRGINHRASRAVDALTPVNNGLLGGGSPADALPSSQRGSTVDGEGDSEAAHLFGAPEVEEIPPTQCLELKHGKVQLRLYNPTPYSGFMDLYISFDRRAEFSAVRYPKLFTLPDLLHCIPRGLRSRHLVTCTPLPPCETPTKGVFVRHCFDFDAGDFIDGEVLAVIREVHRYSLEDQQGLLLSVSNGGTYFESTFLSVTAALASSICFFQRVLVRLDESVAIALRTSITEGPLMIAAYQGQYNDADNMRSAYPDVQIVGPVVYVSNHPPIIAPTLYATMLEPPTLPVAQRFGGPGAHVNEFQAALRQEEFDLAMATRAAREEAILGEPVTSGKHFVPWLEDSTNIGPLKGHNDELGGPKNAAAVKASQGRTTRLHPRRFSETGAGDSISRRQRNSIGFPNDDDTQCDTETMVRFELRSVRRSLPSGGVTLADVRKGSVPLPEDYAVRQQEAREKFDAMAGETADAENPFGFEPCGEDKEAAMQKRAARKVPDDDDVVLPYFLKYLVEQLEGTKVVEESHALVVMVPMSVMHAAVQLSNRLDRSSYIKEYLGPF